MRITTVFKLGRLFAVRRMADAFEAVPRVFFCYNDLIWLCACGVYLAIADILCHCIHIIIHIESKMKMHVHCHLGVYELLCDVHNEKSAAVLNHGIATVGFDLQHNISDHRHCSVLAIMYAQVNVGMCAVHTCGI